LLIAVLFLRGARVLEPRADRVRAEEELNADVDGAGAEDEVDR
jgi:hypothetical protein